MVDIRWIPKVVPTPINHTIKRAGGADVFETVQERLMGTTEVTMQTPVGDITYVVEEDWARLDKVRAGGMYEPALIEALIKRLSPGDCFYDIGARWGTFSLLAGLAGVPRDHIHAFEADTERYQLLSQNHRNSDVHLTNAFVSDHSDAESVTVDEYATTHAPPTVAKIDVDGAEMRVLHGMSEILSSAAPTLFMEIHPKLLHDFDAEQTDVLGCLRNHGYHVDVCVENRDSQYAWVEAGGIDLPDAGDYLIRALQD